MKRTVYVPCEEVKSELLESGYFALAEYSMLNAPRDVYKRQGCTPHIINSEKLTESVLTAIRHQVSLLVEAEKVLSNAELARDVYKRQKVQ